MVTCYFDLRGSCLLGASKVPRTASVPPCVRLLDPGDDQVARAHDLELVRRGEVQELAVLDPPERSLGDQHLVEIYSELIPDHRLGVALWGRTPKDNIVTDRGCGLHRAHQEVALDVCKEYIQ